MNAIDPFSPEVRDPFYVPDRTAEASAFVGAGLLGVLVPVALVAVPIRPVNLAIILAVTLTALMFLFRGMAARRHRLNRTQQVDELRIRTLSEDENTTSV